MDYVLLVGMLGSLAFIIFVVHINIPKVIEEYFASLEAKIEQESSNLLNQLNVLIKHLNRSNKQ